MNSAVTQLIQAALAVVESDAATTVGPVLVTFLEDIEEANGNLGLEAAALLKLEGAAPAAGIQLELAVQQQLVTLALSKLQNYIASKKPVSTAPTPTLAPAPAAARPA